MNAATSYWLEHRNDQVPVPLIDLVSLVARLTQIRSEGDAGLWLLWDRVLPCDLPRLESCLPEQARMHIGDEVHGDVS